MFPTLIGSSIPCAKINDFLFSSHARVYLHINIPSGRYPLAAARIGCSFIRSGSFLLYCACLFSLVSNSDSQGMDTFFFFRRRFPPSVVGCLLLLRISRENFSQNRCMVPSRLSLDSFRRKLAKSTTIHLFSVFGSERETLTHPSSVQVHSN